MPESSSVVQSGLRVSPASAATLVVFIHDLSGGGAERCVARLLEQWTHLYPRLDVHLVVNRPQFSYVVPDLVTVHVLDRPARSVVGVALQRAARLYRTVSLLNRLRPRAVLTHMPWSNLLLLGARAFLPGKPRLVLVEHTSYSPGTGHGVKGTGVRALIRGCYGRADGLIAVSEDLARELTTIGRLPAGFVTAIPNAVDVAALRKQAAEVACAHPWLARPREQPVVVFAGRLEPVKGLDVLLQAWAKVLQRGPARLLILGEGTQRESLQAQASALSDGGASVQLLPFQANPFPFIEQADAFVLPSRREGFPNVLLEAMALGKACVASDCPTGPRELLGENERGLLVPPQDPDALAGALTRVLADAQLRVQLGARAAGYALRLTPQAMAERYATVLLGRG